MTLTSYSALLATMIGEIGEDDFSETVFQTVNAAVGIDHCTAFVTANGEASSIVVGGGRQTGHRRVSDLAASYTAQAWTRDPIWKEITPQTESAPCSKLINPAVYFTGDHRQAFYEAPGITQEIAIIGKSAGASFYISFYRCEGQPEFSAEEQGFFSALSAPIVKIVSKHQDMRRMPEVPSASAPLSRDDLHERVRAALAADESGLTGREAEICAGIVLGYSATALSLTMGISKNTVATHRKRAYAKLNICSQNELFSRLIHQINGPVAQQLRTH